MAAGRRFARRTGFHPDLLRAAAAEELTLQGIDRTMRSMQTYAALPAIRKSSGSSRATRMANIQSSGMLFWRMEAHDLTRQVRTRTLQHRDRTKRQQTRWVDTARCPVGAERDSLEKLLQAVLLQGRIIPKGGKCAVSARVYSEAHMPALSKLQVVSAVRAITMVQSSVSSWRCSSFGRCPPPRGGLWVALHVHVCVRHRPKLQSSCHYGSVY